MSSCWTSAAGGGGVRTCGLNLDIIKSPAAAAAAAAATTNTTTTTTSTIRRKTHHHHHHCSSSSPSSSSSTIAETADSSNSTISSSIRTSSPLISSSSSSTTAVRKPRTPRKRPNQIYNEAAALLSTVYPNIFSTKNLLINSSSTSSAAKFVKPQTEHYSSSSSLNNDDSSAQLFLPLPFPFVKTSSSSQAVVSNYSCNSDSVLSDSNSKPASSKHEDDDKLPSNDNKKHHNASSSLDDDKNDEDFDLDLNYDYDLVAESILEEGNIEQGCGIDSIIGTTTTGLAATDDVIISGPPTPQPPAHGDNNCHGPETNRIDFCCYGYPYPMQMPMPLPVGLGFQVGVGGYGMKTTKCVSAFRTSTTDDGDYWWRFQAVDVGQISPKLNNSSGNSPVSSSDIQNQELGGKEQKKKINNGSSSKKKKKKMEHSNDNNDNTTAAKVDGKIESRILSAVSVSVPGSSGSNEANSIENFDSSKVMLKLNYDNVIDAWSDRPSPFSDEFPGTDTTSDNAGLSARLAQIDLFGENGGIREASVLRYKEKRRNRLVSKKIRYQVRKVNADQRPRMKGRFVRSPNSIVDRQK